MPLEPQVSILNSSQAESESEEEEEGEGGGRAEYVTDEERYMAAVRRAVLRLPEPESDPETEDEEFEEEMEELYDSMVRAWLVRAALFTVLTAVALSLVITYSNTDNTGQATTTTTEGNNNMTTIIESTIATIETATTADNNNMTTTIESTQATVEKTTTATTSTTTENLPTNTTTAASIAISTGVLVLGGFDEDTNYIRSAEVFPPSPCSVPSLEEGRVDHSLSVLGGALVLCGGEKRGYPFISSFNCSTWSPGADSWTFFSSTRVVRKQHLAWSPPSRPDTILLLGGNYNPDYNISPTGEEVPGGANFTLPHEVIDSCGVEDNGTFVVIGGINSNFVTRFGLMGSVLEEMTLLPNTRSNHACGLYPTEEGQALLVAGGWQSSISSVITLLPSASSWTTLNPLPNFPYLTKTGYSMVGGRLWLVGGKVSHDLVRPEVLEYHSSSDTWVVLGNLTTPRYHLAMVAIGPHHLPCLQIP